jgi:hypothetical protein
MANEPAKVQKTILTQLRNEQKKELKLINNLLCEITRIMIQMHDRAQEVERLLEMPQDHPAIRVCLQTLLRNDEHNMNNTIRFNIIYKIIRVI